MNVLHGVVEWINGNPILDGMNAFDTVEEALKYIEKEEEKDEIHRAVPKLLLNVEYTIIEIEVKE